MFSHIYFDNENYRNSWRTNVKGRILLWISNKLIFDIFWVTVLISLTGSIIVQTD